MQVRRLLAVIAVAAVLSSVGACSDDEAGPSGSPSPSGASVSPSVTETQPSVPSEPVPPAAMERDDAEGAKAFAEYYWEVVNYAQATGDTALLKSLERDTCRGCAPPRQWIDEVYASGGHIEGGQFRVTSMGATPLGLPGGTDALGFSVQMDLSATAGSVLGASGEVTERSSATGLAVVLLTSRDGTGSWMLDEWQVER